MKFFLYGLFILTDSCQRNGVLSEQHNCERSAALQAISTCKTYCQLTSTRECALAHFTGITVIYYMMYMIYCIIYI